MAEQLHNKNTGPKRSAAYSGTALLLIGSLAACSGEAPAVCLSPRAISPLFPPDPSATEDRATWKNGIAIHTTVPTDAGEIVVGYRGQNAAEWSDSMPISPDRAQTIAVLLGNGAVSFSVLVQADKDSAICTDRPVVTFSEPQPMQPLIIADATLPQW